MDLTFIILTCFMTLYTDVIVGCKDALMEENKNCFDNYKMYLANLGSSGADSSQIMQLLCSPEGKAMSRCLKPLLEECKELRDDPMYQIFLVLEKTGGCEGLQPSALGVSLEAYAGGCAQDLQNDGDFQACFTGYSMYIAEQASKIDSNVHNGMINILCSKTGTEKIKCAINYIKTCPALMTTGDSAAILNGLQAVESMGDFEQMCSLISGDKPTLPCTTVRQCIEAQPIDARASSPPDGRTPFSYFQFYTGYICGPLKRLLECFKDTGDQCSDLLNNFKERMDMERTKMGSDVTLPTFEEIKRFTLQECSKIPADFPNNTCIRQNLGGDKFVKCFQNISANNHTKKYQTSCDQYRARHQCVSMTVGIKCGDQYSKAIEELTPLYMVGIPRNCELKVSNRSDSSVLIRISSVALFVALVLSFKLT